MTMCHISPRRLPKIHDQESWTLRWHSFSRWGREHLTFCFAYKGSQYFVYDYWQPIAPQITQDTWRRIVDALLMLISMMGQGAFHVLFCLQRQPILHLWQFPTYCHPDYPRFMTKNRWRSVDAHFATGASTICKHLIWHSVSFTVIWQTS